MNKKDIRSKIKDLRESYNKDELLLKSEKICNEFYRLYSHLRVFLFYYPHNNEVNILPLIEKLYLMGKEIYLPSVKGREMVFKGFSGFDNLVEGAYGIYEPVGEELSVEGDIICIPGVAFDERCNRIGYGGGFYDKYLSNHKNIKRTAVAYDFQIIKNIETESFDESVNEIITDIRIIRG